MNYYEILGVKPNASIREINEAYRRYAKMYHPDKNRDIEGFDDSKIKMINTAYETLRDLKKRFYYDVQNGFKSFNRPIRPKAGPDDDPFPIEYDFTGNWFGGKSFEEFWKVFQQRYVDLSGSGIKKTYYEHNFVNEWNISICEILFSIRGRLSQLPFLIFTVLSLCAYVGIVAIMIKGMETFDNIDVESFIHSQKVYLLMLPYLYPFFCMAVKRFHDFNRSGLISLFMLVPGVIFIILAVLLLSPGDEKSNRYGFKSSIAINNYIFFAVGCLLLGYVAIYMQIT